MSKCFQRTPTMCLNCSVARKQVANLYDSQHILQGKYKRVYMNFNVVAQLEGLNRTLATLTKQFVLIMTMILYPVTYTTEMLIS